MAVQLLLQ